MLSFTGSLKIYLAVEPCDMRKRYDAEYVREGSASAFMLAMPHLGKRELFVGKEARRTAARLRRGY